MGPTLAAGSASAAATQRRHLSVTVTGGAGGLVRSRWPDLDFREFCRRSKLPRSERSWDLFAAERYRRGEGMANKPCDLLDRHAIVGQQRDTSSSHPIARASSGRTPAIRLTSM